MLRAGNHPHFGGARFQLDGISAHRRPRLFADRRRSPHLRSLAGSVAVPTVRGRSQALLARCQPPAPTARKVIPCGTVGHGQSLGSDSAKSAARRGRSQMPMHAHLLHQAYAAPFRVIRYAQGPNRFPDPGDWLAWASEATPTTKPARDARKQNSASTQYIQKRSSNPPIRSGYRPGSATSHRRPSRIGQSHCRPLDDREYESWFRWLGSYRQTRTGCRHRTLRESARAHRMRGEAARRRQAWVGRLGEGVRRASARAAGRHLGRVDDRCRNHPGCVAKVLVCTQDLAPSGHGGQPLSRLGRIVDHDDVVGRQPSRRRDSSNGRTPHPCRMSAQPREPRPWSTPLHIPRQWITVDALQMVTSACSRGTTTSTHESDVDPIPGHPPNRHRPEVVDWERDHCLRVSYGICRTVGRSVVKADTKRLSSHPRRRDPTSSLPSRVSMTQRVAEADRQRGAPRASRAGRPALWPAPQSVALWRRTLCDGSELSGPRVLIACDWFVKYAAGLARGLTDLGCEVVLLTRDHDKEFGDEPGAMQSFVKETLPGQGDPP